MADVKPEPDAGVSQAAVKAEAVDATPQAASAAPDPPAPKRSRRHEAPLPPVKVESHVDGRLNCPSCHAAVRPVGDRGCNRIKCMSDAHGSSFFYFCFWCKGEIKGDAYCTNEGCPERIDMSTRRSKQKLQNREARDNPISIDSD